MSSWNAGWCRCCWRWSAPASRWTPTICGACPWTSNSGWRVIERDIHRLTGRVFNVGSAKQLGEVLFDEMKLRRRQADEDRRLGHRCGGAADAGRPGTRAAGANHGMAAASEAEVDLCRCAGGRDQSGHRARAHQLRAGDRVHRTAVVQRSQSAEHPDPHRGRQPHPPRLHRRTGPRAGIGRLLADRAAAAGACGRHSGAARELRPRRGHPRPHRIARCSAFRWRAWTR